MSGGLEAIELAVADRYAEVPGDPHDARSTIAALVASEAPVLAAADADRLVERVHARVRGLGPLQPLADDPRVSDILVNGPGPVWVEVDGRLRRTAITVSARDLELVVERVLGPLGLRLDRTNAIVDARLADGSRFCVVGEPLALDAPVVSIRRFRPVAVGLDEFAGDEVAPLLRDLVARRANLVVFGSTGAGKTTLLSALCDEVPRGERIVSIEDTAELRVDGPGRVRLEARSANAEGAGATSIRQLVRAALRLRPDRLIVGEVRGAEALDMVWALASGHDGSMSTCHASSPLEALIRLETFALMAGESIPLESVRMQVRSAVHMLIGVERTTAGRRVVRSVTEVDPASDGVLRPLVAGGHLVAAPRPR